MKKNDALIGRKTDDPRYLKIKGGCPFPGIPLGE
jgi:hypothetical protein